MCCWPEEVFLSAPVCNHYSTQNLLRQETGGWDLAGAAKLANTRSRAKCVVSHQQFWVTSKKKKKKKCLDLVRGSFSSEDPITVCLMHSNVSLKSPIWTRFSKYKLQSLIHADHAVCLTKLQTSFQLWCDSDADAQFVLGPFCDWLILSDKNMIPAAERTCKRPPKWIWPSGTSKSRELQGRMCHNIPLQIKLCGAAEMRWPTNHSLWLLKECACLVQTPAKITMYLCKIIFITSIMGGCFHPCRFVGWFVSSITQTLLNRFPWNLKGGWVSAQNRTG